MNKEDLEQEGSNDPNHKYILEAIKRWRDNFWSDFLANQPTNDNPQEREDKTVEQSQDKQ